MMLLFSALALMGLAGAASAGSLSNATDTSAWTSETSDTASHGYPLGQGLMDRFDAQVLETGDAAIGALDYYVYAPIAHGAKANRAYPLLLMFHGANNGGVNDKLCGGLTDWMIYAGDEYQRLLGGAYVVFPKANEYATAQEKTVEDVVHCYQPTGNWMSSRRGTSVYSDALALLVDTLKARYPISSLNVIGTSAGGYMAWRFAIDHPQLCRKVVPVAPAYKPTAAELELLARADIGLWVIHGEQDANCPILLYTGAILPQLNDMPNARVTILDTVRFGNRKIVSVPSGGRDIGQHLAQFAVGQNMLYDDGTPYDGRYPDGLIAWLADAEATTHD